jgi:outer membrane protein assembly factor BamB
MKALSISALVCSFSIAPVLDAADWPQFLGPRVDGVAEDVETPVKWDAGTNVVWRAELSRPSNGSPIVAGGNVFVVGAEDSKGTRRSLYCFAKDSGEQRWVRTVEFDKAMPTHKTNPHCSSTPASDGRRVVVWHASAGLFCYDNEGKEVWKRDLGEFRHMWGYGGSPIIHEGKVLLHCGPGARVFVTALELETGKTLWEADEKFDGGTAERSAGGHYRGGWSTPFVRPIDGVETVICSLPTRVVGYDLASGDALWHCDGLKSARGELCYMNPIMGDGDLCYVIGGYGGPSIAFRAGGKGDITASRRVWRSEKNPQSIGTGIFYEGYFYVPSDGGGIRCIDPKDGSVKWQDPAGKRPFWGSMVRVGKRCYVTNRDGATLVFEPSPKGFVKIAENKLGEACDATPAVVGGQIFIRTDEALYCIGGGGG